MLLLRKEVQQLIYMNIPMHGIQQSNASEQCYQLLCQIEESLQYLSFAKKAMMFRLLMIKEILFIVMALWLLSYII